MPSAELPSPIARGIAAFDPVALPELQSTAPLHTRVDRKYVVSQATAEALLHALAADHRILEIDGRRSFEYRSTYFDSEQLGAFRAHVQGRRRRYKCRTRHYVDTGHAVFELKLKGPRGETIKHQLPLHHTLHGTVTDAARTFADGLLRNAYDQPLAHVQPTIHTQYRRVTLAAADATARVTFDFDLRFAGADGGAAAIRDGYVIIECKSARGSSRADAALRSLGERPAECSKYCLGIALLRDDARAHALSRLMRRHFAALPLEARTDPHAA